MQRLSRHVLARTCRPGKLTLSTLEATPAVYLAGRAWEEMPTLRMLNTSEQELSERANAIGKAISATGLKVGVSPDTTECGGAVLPGVLLPTWTVQVEHEKVKEDQLYDALLARGIIARRAQGGVILDLAKCPSRGGIRNAQRDSRFSPVSCIRERSLLADG